MNAKKNAFIVFSMLISVLLSAEAHSYTAKIEQSAFNNEPTPSVIQKLRFGAAENSRLNEIRYKIRDFLSLLSVSEKTALEHFFRCLIQEEQVGYVLLGEKPMSFHSYFLPKGTVAIASTNPLTGLDLFFEGFKANEILFHQGFLLWQKHQHQFSGNNIFFDSVEEETDLHWYKVAVWNKKALEPFKSHFNISSFESLIYDANVKKLIYSNHYLLGIALGYGHHNAELFSQMSAHLSSLHSPLAFPFKPNSQPLNRSKSEYKKLNQSLGYLDDAETRKFLFTLGVSFRADLKKQETRALKSKYKRARRSLTQLYERGGFLENTLELILDADRPYLKMPPPKGQPRVLQ